MSERRRTDVLLLPTVAGVGGSTRVVATLAEQWRSRGVGVDLVFPDPGASDTQAALDWLARGGVGGEAAAELPAWYSPHGFRDLWRFTRWVRRRNARAVYLHFGSNQIAFRDVLAARLACRGRVSLMVHHAAPIPTRRRQFLTRLGALFARHLVVSTPVMADLLAGIGVPRTKMTIVPPAVPRPSELPAREESRAQFEIPAGAFVVSCVARLDRGKNVLELVEAVANLADDTHLIVAGTGETLDEVRDSAARLLGNRGHILGRVPSVEEVYAASDVFALPSSEEGFGLVFLEAAWHRVPSIGCDVGGVRYAIAQDETGVVTQLHDVEALTGALRRFRDDHEWRTKLGAAARARVEREFDPAKMAEAHLAALIPE